jgi:aryl-alcohol dehydrogenase-like predicted oxidoreductase
MTLSNESDTFDVGGDLTVNRLGFGAMRLTGEDIIGPPDDEDEARDVLRRAVELGVDFIDTADSYGPGVSERLIGETLDVAGDDVVVATKAGLLRTFDGDWPRLGDPEYLENALLCSLDRLGADTIDLYQFHRPDPDVPYEESVQKFAEFKDKGYVKHVGLSNASVEQLETAREIVDVATVQNRYNVGNREHEPVLEYCEENDIGFIPWFPLGAGELGDAREAVDDVADAHDATRAQVALAWLLEHSSVTLPIPGTSSIEHLEENVAAASLSLSDDEIERLTAAAPPR